MATMATETMTAAQFFEWVHRPENANRHFELERGEVIEMPLPGKYHGFVCGNVSAILGNFAASRGRGYVCTNDAGVIVGGDPDTVRGPDVTFYEDAQTSDDMERQYAADPPLLAVDVMSPTDRINRVSIRISQLLRRGVPMVWVIDPEARDISIYTLGRDPILLTEKDTLVAEELLPGIRIPVKDLFALPGQTTH
ncbi:MAG: Uma2 family endonuclease [Planctomycetota bacterium]|nr:Uma2 family endonuclease [Planctomycetota bacterium]